MLQLKISPIAFRNAPEKIFYSGKEELTKRTDVRSILFTDFEPDVLYFLSGGSEAEAITKLDKTKFQVSELLKDVILKHRLDAVTVECFSLVQKNPVTACLALSDLNDLNIPAGCEGDLPYAD